MHFSSFKIQNKLKLILSTIFSLLLIGVSVFSFWQTQTASTSGNVFEWNNNIKENETETKKYIKWFEFNVSYDVLDKTSKLDINSHTKNEAVNLNWIELISYLACKYGNDFSKFKQKDLDAIIEKLRSGQSMAELTKDMKNYAYYFEGYDAVLHEFIGDYQVEVKTASENEISKNSQTNTSTENATVKNIQTNTLINNSQGTVENKNSQELTNSEQFKDKQTEIQEIKQFEPKYGLKAFHPVAKNYSYSHYDDFGASRSYGYKRLHFGNDLMGSIGAPIIAVESGVVEATGWNQYGGWRIGIRSFDKKRYYYYAHLRKNHPYSENLKEGQIVKAGDVIGYLGMTGYSTKENVNNINVPHLHFGIQLIFDEIQKEGPNQIWVDLYDLVDFLKRNRSEVYKSNLETKDYSRKYDIIDPSVPEN